MSYGYVGDTSTSIKQQVKNAGVLSVSDVLDLEGKGQLGGSLELIEEQTVSSVTTVDFLTIKENKFDECIAIEGYCALHLINDKPKYSVSFNKENNTHHVSCKNNKIIHNEIENIEKIRL